MSTRFKSKIRDFFNRKTNQALATPPTEDQSETDAVSEHPTTTPIDILPNELLLVIFTHNATRSQSSFHDTLYTSHVNRRWRNLSLSCPELWRRYAFLHTHQRGSRGLAFSQAILDRCGELTLDVGWERLHRTYRTPSNDFTLPSADANRALDLEIETMPRFRSYAILFTSKLEALVSQRWLYAPRNTGLEELAVDSGDIFTRRRFPYNFTDSRVASLKCLQLRACSLDMTTIRTDCLRVLEVAYSPMQGQYSPRVWSSWDWIACLEGCPRLVKLGLSTPGFRNDASSTPAGMALEGAAAVQSEDSQPTIQLYEVVEMNFIVPVAFLKLLFRSISFPALRKVSLALPNTVTLLSDVVLQYSSVIDSVITHTIAPLLSQQKLELETCISGEKTLKNRLQIAFGPSRYLYMGFTPSPSPRSMSASSTTHTELDLGGHMQFPWVLPSSASDFVSIRVRQGGLRLRELLTTSKWASDVVPHVAEVRYDVPAVDAGAVDVLQSVVEGHRCELMPGCV